MDKPVTSPEQSETKKSKQPTNLRAVAWLTGVIALVTGVTLVFSQPIAGLFWILGAALLLPPVIDFVQRKWHRTITRNQRIVFAIVFIFIAGAASASHATPAQSNPVSATPAVSTNTPTTPQTSQQKLISAVQAQLQHTSLQSSYQNSMIDDENDPTRPKGAQYVTIDVNTGDAWDENAYITTTGTLTASIYQSVFPIDPNFYDVLVRYYGQTTDQYGNATTSMLMSYGIDRPLYNKINWSGLSSVGNDIHLCAFLREDFNTMSQSQQNNSYVGCAVLPGNLRTAEDTIETDSPQYADIPHYGS